MRDISLILLRIRKLLIVLCQSNLRRIFFSHFVMAGVEHKAVLNLPLATVVDIGANRGQFALAARAFSRSRIFSFEPLAGPAEIFRRVFSGDDQVVLHQSAIGPTSVNQQMHVSARDDSSSLLPISSVQTSMFPGTEEVSTVEVRVAPLNEFVTADDLLAPAMLKLDVQGFELEALRGCESLLQSFEWVYCECSFMELYAGQKMASEVIEWLAARNFGLNGVYNLAYDHDGQAVQSDFLFRRKVIHSTTGI